MSMYGDDENGRDKEGMLYEIEEFLENHTFEELMRIIADAMSRKGI